ncbi:MAG TPA: Sip1-related alpha-galactosidase [Pyrinomonadaceae bacterium]|nr:Sip1-related alpha-galactosidase [Pyrinomonadaceae bacterium]
MTIKRLALAHLFLLFAFDVNILAQETPRAARNAQADSGVTAAVERGLLQVKSPGGPVLMNVRPRLRFSDGSSLIGEFEPAVAQAGSDESGSYESLRFRLKPAAAQTARVPTFKAALEIRLYREPRMLLAFLDYEGPALAAREGVQLVMGLDSFERGMAVKRFKLYWTSPQFVSDHRLLGPANQLLLWRRVREDNYHLLVPLAGDGMIGEVGVSEIDYRYEFRVAASSYDPEFAPRRVPLFAYSVSNDPYRLPPEVYKVAFAASKQYGRLRWDKSYPEVFEWLGWCSWNAYGQEVTAEKVVNSVRSLREKQIPVGFVLVDDGWLTVREQKLAAYGADTRKFPGDLAALARTLRGEYRIPHVGVWHTFQGYWNGVEADSDIGRAHALFKGLDGKALPDPRDGKGEKFFADWYARLKEWGYDFVKVDGQGNNVKFTDGLMPLFASGGGSHRNLQEAARKYFGEGRSDYVGLSPGLSLINCMEMSLENAFNWSVSNVARNSDDYLPEVPHNPKDHVYQNAYNAYWTANFAYPDWDMFQSHDARGEFHAVARAVSGGPVYITDEPGKERAEIVRPLAFSDGKLLMLDEPGQVTRDVLLADVALEPAALKVFGRITQPGLKAGMVAAFNVNKGSQTVTGRIGTGDVEGLLPAGESGAAPVAVYQRSSGRAVVLTGKNAGLQFSLADFGHDLFTLVPMTRGVAVFGLLDKYLGPAAVVSQKLEAGRVTIRLREAGDFGAMLARPPAGVELDGRKLPPSSYSYREGLLRVPRSSFGGGAGEREIRILLARPGR